MSIMGCRVSVFTVITRRVSPDSSSVSIMYRMSGFPHSGRSCLQQPIRVESPPARSIATGIAAGLPVLRYAGAAEMVSVEGILVGMVCIEIGAAEAVPAARVLVGSVSVRGVFIGIVFIVCGIMFTVLLFRYRQPLKTLQNCKPVQAARNVQLYCGA